MTISTVHIVWGELAASKYRLGHIDNTVRLAHAVYDFQTTREAAAFLLGVHEARRPHEWAQVTRLPDQRSMGMPLRSRLIDAIVKGDLATVEEMLDAGVSPDTKAPNGMTAVQVAAHQGQDLIAEKLLERGAAPEEPADSLNPYSAIHLAAASSKPGASRVVDLLSERRIDIERGDRDGRTALMRAIDESRLDSARLLLEKGAKTSTADNAGVTAKDRFERKFGGVVGDPAVGRLEQAFEVAEQAEQKNAERVAAVARSPFMRPTPYNTRS